MSELISLSTVECTTVHFLQLSILFDCSLSGFCSTNRWVNVYVAFGENSRAGVAVASRLDRCKRSCFGAGRAAAAVVSKSVLYRQRAQTAARRSVDTGTCFSSSWLSPHPKQHDHHQITDRTGYHVGVSPDRGPDRLRLPLPLTGSPVAQR